MSDQLVLLIRAWWQGLPLAARRYDAPDAVVTLGEGAAHQWRLCGVPLGCVPEAAAPWLRLSPPLLSTVQPVPAGCFGVPRGSLEGAVRPVWHRVPGGCVVDVEPGWHPRLCAADVPPRRPARWPSGPPRPAGPSARLVELDASTMLEFQVGGVWFETRLRPTD